MWGVDGGVRSRDEGYRGEARQVMVHSGKYVNCFGRYRFIFENTHAALRIIDILERFRLAIVYMSRY